MGCLRIQSYIVIGKLRTLVIGTLMASVLIAAMLMGPNQFVMPSRPSDSMYRFPYGFVEVSFRNCS